MPVHRSLLPVPIAAAGMVLFSSCHPEETRNARPELRLAPPAPSYNFAIRPILARKCFPCHGPDLAGNESGVRLDTARDATSPTGATGGRAIVPGDPAASGLWQRIEAGEPDGGAPPSGSAHHLEKGEKDLIKRWIQAGAPYAAHWAFQAVPAPVPLPAIRDSSWPRNGIDHFVVAGFEENFETPPTATDPLGWLDRSTRALTGLPPAKEETEAFQQAVELDPESAAERACERLLASPAFGAQMASFWLARLMARDADGSPLPESTPPAPYRRWVTNAFNRNLPYDQFLVEQIAGDLLKDARPDQVTATAFNRIHRPPNPGGTSETDALEELAARRVDTLGSAILGLTLQRARHHHHPADPITRNDYHGLLAFFNSIGESGRVATLPGIVPAPTLPLPTKEQREALYRATMREADTENLLRQARLDGEADFLAWLANPDKLPVISDLVGAFSFDQAGPQSPNQSLASGDPAECGTLRFVAGPNGKAVQFNGATPVRISGLLETERWAPWTFSLWIKDPVQNPESVALLSRETGSGPERRGLDLRLAGGRLTARLTREWPGNAIGVRSAPAAVPKDQWVLLTWTYDGSSRAAGLRLYLDGLPLPTEPLADRLWKTCAGPGGEDQAPLLLGAGPGDRGFAGGLLDDLQVFSRALTPIEVLQLRTSDTLATATAGEATEEVRSYYFSSIHPESRRLTTRLEAERRETILSEEPVLEVSVMRELPVPRPAVVPGTGTPVSRGTPSFLPPLRIAGSDIRDPAAPIGAPSRLDLARWLTRPDHPLTARVFVNRLWAHFFGEGLVATTGDFGLLGTPPSDPALLDWLARDFIEHDWDIKRLCRQIVLSSAYRARGAPE